MEKSEPEFWLKGWKEEVLDKYKVEERAREEASKATHWNGKECEEARNTE